MRMRLAIAGIICFIFTMTSCSTELTSEENQITISAAASLKEVLDQVSADFTAKHPEIEILFNFGGSGSLQQQIIQGAPVDMFISAAESKFNELVDDNLINSHVQLLGNELVLVVSESHYNEHVTLENLLQDQFKRISIGTPESVPAGLYAKQALKGLNLWDQLESKIIQAKDVRQVLTYVETDNVDAGVVYKTDALQSQKVKMAATFDSSLHAPIIYPAGIVSSTKKPDETSLFLKFLESPEARETFEKYGFTVLD